MVSATLSPSEQLHLLLTSYDTMEFRRLALTCWFEIAKPLCTQSSGIGRIRVAELTLPVLEMRQSS